MANFWKTVKIRDFVSLLYEINEVKGSGDSVTIDPWNNVHYCPDTGDLWARVEGDGFEKVASGASWNARPNITNAEILHSAMVLILYLTQNEVGNDSP